MLHARVLLAYPAAYLGMGAARRAASDSGRLTAGDQADVLMWRVIGVAHLLLANITQNLEVRSFSSPLSLC